MSSASVFIFENEGLLTQRQGIGDGTANVLVRRKLGLNLEDIIEVLDLDLVKLNAVDGSGSGGSGGRNGESHSTEDNLELHSDV